MDNEWQMPIIPAPDYKYQLLPFGNKNLIIYFERRPSLWRRFWMRLFFGWKFEEIADEESDTG